MISAYVIYIINVSSLNLWGFMHSFRSLFPIFSQKRIKPFVYFDSAATTQKPQSVIDAVSNYYTQSNSSVSRGIYALGEKTTQLYEAVRYKVARFLNAPSSAQIVFTSGATASINTVVAIWAHHALQAGDEIVITQAEHHSNFVPWQQFAQKNNIVLKVIPVAQDGTLIISSALSLITAKTKLVAITHVANATGIYTPLKAILDHAHALGAYTLVDGAQAVPFQAVDVQELGCDFYVFSGHKMLAPTGVGILYMSRRAQKTSKPAVYGGGMVFEVNEQDTSFLPAPLCFEAGTPAIAQIIGLGAALDVLARNDITEINRYTCQLIRYCVQELQKIPYVKIIGSVDLLKKQSHIVSFTVDGMHAHDIAAYLDTHGICVRAGNHCAQPLAQALGYDASVRISLYAYNTQEEIDYCIKVLTQLRIP